MKCCSGVSQSNHRTHKSESWSPSRKLHWRRHGDCERSAFLFVEACARMCVHQCLCCDARRSRSYICGCQTQPLRRWDGVGRGAANWGRSVGGWGVHAGNWIRPLAMKDAHKSTEEDDVPVNIRTPADPRPFFSLVPSVSRRKGGG